MKVRVIDGTVLIGEARMPGDVVEVTLQEANEVIALGRAVPVADESTQPVDTGGGAGIDEAPEIAAPLAMTMDAGGDDEPGEADDPSEPVRRKRGRPRKNN